MGLELPYSMITPIPLGTFSPDLVPGESIGWSGQPNASVIFHREDWGFIPFTLAWGGLAIFGLLSFLGVVEAFNPHKEPLIQFFDIIGCAFLVLVGQYMIWGRFFYVYWRKKRTWYALTNRRALIVIDGFWRRRSSSAWFIDLLLIDKRVERNGIGFVSFGGPATGELRWGTNNPPRPLTFDDVDHADAVHQAAFQLMEKARASHAASSR